MSGNLENTIRNTKNLQDMELAEAITHLKGNPAALRAWAAEQQARVMGEVTRQKQQTIDKVYGDFDRATKVEESILMHNKRAEELSELVDNVYKNQEESAQAVVHDKDLASRKKEMNEWTVGNKQDTLFVFSSLFILLSGLILLTGLWRMGMISSALWIALSIPMVLLFFLILIRRWRYTDVLRNKRYWNKQIFEGKSKKISVPSCSQMERGMESAMGSVAGVVAGAV